jgi:hypothetical protein
VNYRSRRKEGKRRTLDKERQDREVSNDRRPVLRCVVDVDLPRINESTHHDGRRDEREEGEDELSATS